MQRIEVTCPECCKTFHVPASMKGGVSNCPHCGRLTSLPARFEPLYWGLVGCGFLTVLVLSGLAFLISGPMGGGIVFMLGMATLVTVSLAA